MLIKVSNGPACHSTGQNAPSSFTICTRERMTCGTQWLRLLTYRNIGRALPYPFHSPSFPACLLPDILLMNLHLRIKRLESEVFRCLCNLRQNESVGGNRVGRFRRACL